MKKTLIQVSRIGGKSGQGRRVLGNAIRDTFDHKWRSIVTKELGFESLEEMQRVRREELAAQAAAATNRNSNCCQAARAGNGVAAAAGRAKMGSK